MPRKAKSNNHDFVDIAEVFKGGSDNLSRLKEIIAENANALKKEVKNDSPVAKNKSNNVTPGTYKAGWTVKKDAESDTSVRYRIYNKGKQSSLVHLLEFGHDMKTGNTVTEHVNAIPHVLDNRNKIEEQIEKEVEEMLNGLFD